MSTNALDLDPDLGTEAASGVAPEAETAKGADSAGSGKPHRASVPKRPMSRGLAVVVALWTATAIGGLGWMMQYKQGAGRAAVAPPTWPQEASFGRDPNVATLVMVVHQKCSCSRASVSELARLMTRVSGRVTAHVLFVRPEGLGEEWAKTDTYESAAAIPGVQVHVDHSGAEAKRFGALTSGQTYLYAPDGKLLFSGGVTPARGHEGDNGGTKTITAIVNAEMKGRSDAPATNVYGCEIPDHT